MAEHPDLSASNRPFEPEHPMMLDGCVVDGDTKLMVRCLLEELLFTGIQPERIRLMSQSNHFHALFAARKTLGDEEFDNILDETVHRIGIQRATVIEADPTVIDIEIYRSDS